MVITFEELRHIKDSLPHGSIERIANELNFDMDTVRNYFGADHYQGPNKIADVHFEKGAHGGTVKLEDTKILECARKILNEVNHLQHT